MDIANQTWGMVIGTGESFGTCFRMGHLQRRSHVDVRCECQRPKTLVKHLVKWVAEHDMDDASRATLLELWILHAQAGTDSGR